MGAAVCGIATAYVSPDPVIVVMTGLFAIASLAGYAVAAQIRALHSTCTITVTSRGAFMPGDLIAINRTGFPKRKRLYLVVETSPSFTSAAIRPATMLDRLMAFWKMLRRSIR